MKQRKLLGVATCLTGVPSLLVLFMYLLTGKSLLHPEMPEFLLTVITSCVGGVLLWKGKKAGYYLAAVAWGLMLIGNSMNIITVMNIDGFKLVFEQGFDFQIFTKPFLVSVARSVVALLVLLVLLRDLFLPNLQVSERFKTSGVDGSWDGGRTKPD